jgi:hypothetical protein
MRTKTILSALAVSAALTTVSAPAGAAAPKPDTATGTGYSVRMTSFTFSVKERLGATPASGSASFVNPFFKGADRDRSGAVVCARVDGNRGVFGIKDQTPAGKIRYLLFYVEDLGTPASKNAPGVDRLAAVGKLTTAPPAGCLPSLPTAGRGSILLSGNIVVKDVANGDDWMTVS